MKISNETKVGALAAIAITLLILGFNYLKGKSLFDSRKKIYALYGKVDGLNVSNGVFINGVQVGTVSDIHEADKDLNQITVVISLDKDINIPKNSIAEIKGNPLGTSTININKGDSKYFMNKGDTLKTENALGITGELKKALGPVMTKVEGSLQSLDSVLRIVGSMFDEKAKNNIQGILGNVNSITAQLITSSASLNSLLNNQSGALAQSLNNMSAFTGNLAKNNEQVTKMMANAEKATANIANLKLDETLATLSKTMEELKTTIGKINSKEGSLGMLINDKKLYNNLESTTRSLNTLIDDLRVHPKRYVSISVFGKKDKTGPLLQPVINDTLNNK
jgi:phospholipid/cholesterol/gamma-HCH transport system substrate-binding protein